MQVVIQSLKGDVSFLIALLRTNFASFSLLLAEQAG
jgi:hypothetical protein